MRDKKILVISPQSWGKMFVAKHHYAIELARLGNQVFFMNPPVDKKRPFVNVRSVPEYPGLRVVDHGVLFPLMIRFRLRPFFDLLMKLHVKWIVKKLGQSFDLVWCFEPNLYSNLDWFNARKKVYHPVDELFYEYQFTPGKNADLVISVTTEILDKFTQVCGKKIFVNHGISREFAEAATNYHWQKRSPVTIGYSGNLLRKDIDFNTLKECIQQFPESKFVFWGNFNLKQSNLAGSENPEIVSFIEFLKHAPNAELKGGIAMSELIREYSRVDIFLICYDIQKDQSRGTNYHKVMEFLSTGRVIVSNNITTYRQSNLLRMCNSRTSNEEFAKLLGDTIAHCEEYNSADMQRMRKDFAVSNTYRRHIQEIESQLY